MKVITKSNEQILPIELEPSFSFESTNYSAHLNLEIVPVLASIPCTKCGKSTRDIMQGSGIEIDDDDMNIDVLQLIHSNASNESRSALEPDYVFTIISVDSPDITDIDSMIKLDDHQKISKRVSKHISKKLLDEIVCDSCFFTTDHIDNILSA